MFQGIHKYINTFLMIFFLFFSVFSLNAIDISNNHEPQTIRVGFSLLSKNQNEAGNSINKNYGYSLLQRLRLYTGWKYDYVGNMGDASLPHMLSLLQDGKIDLIAGVLKTPEREKIFNYSDQAIANIYTIITVKEGNNTFSTEDYTQWNHIVVGCLKDTPTIKIFEDYAQKHHFTYTLKNYNTQQELSDALQNDHINCIISNNLRILHNEWVIDKFQKELLYIVTPKENIILANQVNKGLDQLFQAEPKLKSELHTLSFDENHQELVYFTREELAFIKTAQQEGKIFSAIINPDIRPYSSLHQGKIAGSNLDICQLIFKKAGLQFALSDISTPEEYIHLVDNKTPDVILDFMFDYYNAENYGYYECSPYYSDSISSIQLKNKHGDEIKTIAITNTLQSFKQYFYQIRKPDTSLVICKDTNQCIDYVKKGTVDAAYFFTNSAQKILQDDSTNAFICTKIPETNVGFSIGINENQNKILSSILEKCTASIHSNDIKNIATSYLREPEKPFSLIAFIYSNPITILLIVLCIVIIIVLLLYLSISAKRNKQTRELNEQLQLALHSSSIANKAKSNFLARMSHEIRTPMNAIIGFTELAKDDKITTEEIKDYLNKITISSKLLLSLINDILDMSAIENEKMKISKQNFDLKEVIHNLSTIFTKQAKKKGIDFTVQIHQIDHEFLVGDELRTNQILINLLSNSIKFTPPSHCVTLTIKEGEEQQGLIPVQFIVKDTGCGMSENMRERLFQPFEQEDASTAHKYGGSGLGLSIAKNLITLMQGSIQVESELEKGTTFTVTIPYGVAPLPAQSVHLKDNDFSNLHTIIIDKNKDAYHFLETLLQTYKIDYDYLLFADTALEKMEKAKTDNHAYNLCFIGDIYPEMKRDEFIKKIRTFYGLTMTIVLIEPQDTQTKEESNLPALGDFVLTEPIFQSTLLDLLMKLSMPQKLEQLKKKTRSSYDFTGKHVLLAEDVDLNREVAKKLLERVHIDVDTACNGQEAVDAYLRSPSHYYDCILLDINMPIMDGYEASKTIRLSLKPDAQTIPLYAMTANAFAEDIANAMNAGMNGHIAKPIQTTRLYRTLEKAFYSQELGTDKTTE